MLRNVAFRNRQRIGNTHQAVSHQCDGCRLNGNVAPRFHGNPHLCLCQRRRIVNRRQPSRPGAPVVATF